MPFTKLGIGMLLAFGLSGFARADLSCTVGKPEGKLQAFTLSEEGHSILLTYKAAVLLALKGEKSLLTGEVVEKPTRVGNGYHYQLVDSSGEKAVLSVSSRLALQNCHSRVGCDDNVFSSPYSGSFSYQGNQYAVSCSTLEE